MSLQLPDYCSAAIELLESFWTIDDENFQTIEQNALKAINEKLISTFCLIRTLDLVAQYRPHKCKIISQIVEDLSPNIDFKSLDYQMTNIKFNGNLIGNETIYSYFSDNPERTPEYFVFFDDADKLSDLIGSNNNIDINTYGGEFNLLNRAARWGSLQCFKYLLMNGANFSNMTMICALNGGNYEIIRICERQVKMVAAYGCAALQYHRIEIVHWMEESYNYKFDIAETLPSHNLTLFAERLKNFDIINGTVGADCNSLLSEVSKFPFHFLIKFLLEKGADYNAKNYFCFSPFLHSVENAIIENARIYLDLGAKIDDDTFFGLKAINIAAQNGHINMLKFLLERGAYVDTKGRDEKTPLFNALSGKHLEAVKLLINHGANIEERDGMGLTPLMRAAEGNMLEIMEYLISQGADIDAKTSLGGATIFFTYQPLNFDAFLLLAQKGTNVYVENERGVNILIMAIKAVNYQLIEYLLENYPKFDVNRPQNSDYNPLIAATVEKDIKIIDMLLNKGANINSTDSNGNTPLMLSVYKNEMKIAEFLLQKGAKMDIKNTANENAFIIAVVRSKIEIIKFLLESGADPNSGNENAPLHYAILRGVEEIVDLLIQSGAKPSMTDLITASMNGKSSIFEKLSTKVIV